MTTKKLEHAKREKGDDDFWDFYILWTIIQDTLDQFDRIMAEIRERIVELLDQIEAINDKLLELDDDHAAIEKELDYFQKNGVFDLDENGNFKDPRARAVVEEYERRTGKDLDLNDPESCSILMEIWMAIDIERRQLQHNLQAHTNEYEHCQDQLEKAQQIKDDP